MIDSDLSVSNISALSSKTYPFMIGIPSACVTSICSPWYIIEKNRQRPVAQFIC